MVNVKAVGDRPKLQNGHSPALRSFSCHTHISMHIGTPYDRSKTPKPSSPCLPKKMPLSFILEWDSLASPWLEESDGKYQQNFPISVSFCLDMLLPETKLQSSHATTLPENNKGDEEIQTYMLNSWEGGPWRAVTCSLPCSPRQGFLARSSISAGQGFFNYWGDLYLHSRRA